MEALYPEPESEAAREGTAAHWYVTEAVQGRVHPVGALAPNGVPLDAEMVECGAAFVDYAATLPHPALLDVGHRAELLRLRLTSVVAADTTGAEAVEVADVLAAAPDPFAAVESAWLEHLEQDHGDLVHRIARHIPAAERRGRIRPLGLDRYGLRLRLESGRGDHDVRIPFPEPADDAESLGRALRRLVGCPFANGLRARH